jgi:prepilin-type N-terminal cleavage/methylation domain-containing protein
MNVGVFSVPSLSLIYPKKYIRGRLPRIYFLYYISSMKLTTRGFTLVELMIVIAIIGILAAALFPSLTSYLARGRDTSRTAGIKEIVTALAAYQLDRTALPAPVGTTCVDSGALVSGGYLQKFPVDPTANRSVNCGTIGAYGFGTGNTAASILTYTVSAIFENPQGGNTGAVSSYQGNALAINTIMAVDTFTKGF